MFDATLRGNFDMCVIFFALSIWKYHTCSSPSFSEASSLLINPMQVLEGQRLSLFCVLSRYLEVEVERLHCRREGKNLWY